MTKAKPFNASDYAEFNRTLPDPIGYSLSRPFFSDVNLVIWFAADCLINRQQLLISDFKFKKAVGVRWNEAHGCTVPVSDAPVPPEMEMPNGTVNSLRGRLREHVANGTVIDIPELKFQGSVFDLCRHLSSLMAFPHASTMKEAKKIMKKLGLEKGKYAAVHVRRGDKINNRDKKDYPIESYIRVIDEIAEDETTCFVMTDDVREIECLKELKPSVNWLGITPDESLGFLYTDFLALPSSDQTNELARLNVEIEISRNSRAFVGWMHSNVSNYIMLNHRNPDLAKDAFRPRTIWRPC